MTFARVVFALSGALGLVACAGVYLQPGTPTFFGLIAGVWAWQVAFFLIAWDPRRFRLMMVPAVIEKLVWVATMMVIYLRGQLTAAALASAIVPHGLMGVLFVVAFLKTPRA